MDEGIRVEVPTISDALYLMMALRGFPAKLVDGNDGPEVEVRPIPRAEHVQSILTTAANWLADRELDSTRIHVSGSAFRLEPEAGRLRRRAIPAQA